MGKQVKSKHLSVTEVQTSRSLELLQIDLMGLARVQSLGEKKYILVVVDVRVVLLRDTAEAPEKMIHLCNDQGIHQEFSSLKTPQQNAIVEWKNRVVQEMAHVILHNKKMPKSI